MQTTAFAKTATTSMTIGALSVIIAVLRAIQPTVLLAKILLRMLLIIHITVSAMKGIHYMMDFA
jgi:hypothetical protein